MTEQDDAAAQAHLAELEHRLGFPIPRLELAMTHRSFAYERGGLPTNERLEFLGDSVLGLVVTDKLFNDHPDLPEGQLAKLRAAVVNSKALADVARTLGVGEFLRLGRGEEATGGRDKSSILADAMEAIIGAVYLDHGLGRAGELVHTLFDPLIDDAASRGAGLDWKTSLQELAAATGVGVPEYVVSETGPDHAKTFEARVRIGDRLFRPGVGRSKKEAEQGAASAAYAELSAGSAGSGSAGPSGPDDSEDSDDSDDSDESAGSGQGGEG